LCDRCRCDGCRWECRRGRGWSRTGFRSIVRADELRDLSGCHPEPHPIPRTEHASALNPAVVNERTVRRLQIFDEQDAVVGVVEARVPAGELRVLSEVANTFLAAADHELAL